MVLTVPSGKRISRVPSGWRFSAETQDHDIKGLLNNQNVFTCDLLNLFDYLETAELPSQMGKWSVSSEHRSNSTPASTKTLNHQPEGETIEDQHDVKKCVYNEELPLQCLFQHFHNLLQADQQALKSSIKKHLQS